MSETLIYKTYGDRTEIRRFPMHDIRPVLRISAFCSAFVDVRPAGFSYPGEMHDVWECVFILKGRAAITAGESVYCLGEGQMIFHPPMEFHRIRTEGDESLHFAVFSFRTEQIALDTHRICAFPSSDVVIGFVKDLRQCFVTDGTSVHELKDASCASALQSVTNGIENFLLGLLNHKEQMPAAEHDKKAALYFDAVSVMQENLSVRLSAAQIAERCGMSVSTMQKLFLRYTGVGMMGYYTSLRMQYGKRLLENGMSVKEVASYLGFGDQNYFSTVYRRHFGEPPSVAKSKGVAEQKNS